MIAIYDRRFPGRQERVDVGCRHPDHENDVVTAAYHHRPEPFGELLSQQA